MLIGEFVHILRASKLFIQFFKKIIPLKLFKIRGSSMFPLICDGDYVLFRSVTRFDKLEYGDVVQIKHCDFGNIVKLIDSVDRVSVGVKGISTLSIDTYSLGYIPKSDIHYVAIAIFSNSQRYLPGIGSFRIFTRFSVQAFLEHTRCLD